VELVLARVTRGSTIPNTEEMRLMRTGKPRIDMAARLAEKVAHLEREPVVGLALVPLRRISAAPIVLAVEHRISGPVIGQVLELVQEILTVAIAQAVARVLV
jgi:hypothetical protein